MRASAWTVPDAITTQVRLAGSREVFTDCSMIEGSFRRMGRDSRDLSISRQVGRSGQ